MQEGAGDMTPVQAPSSTSRGRLKTEVSGSWLLYISSFKYLRGLLAFSFSYILTLVMTHCQDECTSLSGGVPKNLTLRRMNKIFFQKYHEKAEIQSFPMMYMKGGSTFGQSQSKRGFSPKDCLKNSFWGGHKSGSSDFGGGWDPQY